MTEGARQEGQGGGAVTHPTDSWLAWSLASLCVTLYVLSIPMFLLARSAHVPSSWRVDLTLAGLLGGASFLIFPLVGVMIASRRTRNPIGWLCLTIGLLWTFSGLLEYYDVYSIASLGSLPFPLTIAWVNNWLWVPAVGLMGTYVFLLFPDGRLPSRRWRPLAWICGVVIASVSIGVAFGPGPLQDLGGVQNPFVELRPWMMPAFWVSLPLLPLCMLASALSLVLRYRHSGGEERQQIKWIAFSASVVAVVYLIAMIASLVFPADSWTTVGPVWWLNLLTHAALLSFVAIPIAVGIAILKYRLYDPPHSHRPRETTSTRCSRLHPGNRGLLHPIEATHTVVHRQTLLPREVRCQKDPGSLLDPVARRNRP